MSFLNIVNAEYSDIKAALLSELRGQQGGKYYFNDGAAWVEFSKEPGGYYVAILKAGPVQLAFRFTYVQIEVAEATV